MPGNKSEQIKLYFTIGLALVLVVSGYFRVIRPRLKGTANATASSSPAAPAAVPVLQTPEIRTKPSSSKNERTKKIPKTMESMSSMVRDIFAEPAHPQPAAPVKDAPPPSLPPSVLKGTIVGGENPVAIINGKFFRMGDRIGDYQVVRIDKDEVLLSSGNHEIVLEVLKHVHN